MKPYDKSFDTSL